MSRGTRRRPPTIAELQAAAIFQTQDVILAARRLVATTRQLHPDWTPARAQLVALYAVQHMDELTGEASR